MSSITQEPRCSTSSSFVATCSKLVLPGIYDWTANQCAPKLTTTEVLILTLLDLVNYLKPKLNY